MLMVLFLATTANPFENFPDVWGILRHPHRIVLEVLLPFVFLGYLIFSFECLSTVIDPFEFRDHGVTASTHIVMLCSWSCSLPRSQIPSKTLPICEANMRHPWLPLGYRWATVGLPLEKFSCKESCTRVQ